MSSSPGSSWTKADDDYLWTQFGHLPRNASGGISTAGGVSALVTAVASRFNRTSGAITSRMKHLDDPTHFAHARMFGGGAEDFASIAHVTAAVQFLGGSGGGGYSSPSPKRPRLTEVPLSSAEEAVFQSLRWWRLQAAAAAPLDGKPRPAFTVFSDVTLRELCRRRPATRQEMLTVYGIGAHKLEQFGTTLLLALTAACAVNNLPLGLSGGSAGAAIAIAAMEGAGQSSDGSVTLSPMQAAAVRQALQGL